MRVVNLLDLVQAAGLVGLLVAAWLLFGGPAALAVASVFMLVVPEVRR